MLTRIDHVMICVPELEKGMEAYRRLGFNIAPGGVHTGKGTHNAIAFNQDDYVELLAIRDRAEYDAARGPWGGLPKFIEAGGGLRYVILQSDDLEKDVAAMRARGVDIGDVTAGERVTPDGTRLQWKSATLGERDPLPLFFIQHLTSVEARRKATPGAGRHPNGVQRIERTYIAVNDLAAEAKAYARVLGVKEPKIERGTVIMADMAVFNLGASGLTLAHPYAAGAAAEALQRRGPGPFQVLFRASGLDDAARWMKEHGVPPPARGIRNTGEHALLVPPTEACGLYLGLVGPA